MAPKARRYAQAAFDIAFENDTFDEWAADLDALATALGDEDFAALLDAPQVPMAVKMDGIDKVLADLGETARNLAKLLVTHRASRIAPAIRDDFRAMLDGRRGIARAEITTAVAVDAALRSEIVTLLSSLVDQEITATFSADPQILGGMVAHVGDRLVDGSVRSKLESLRQTLGRPAAISTRDG
ncbi:MAG: ATP synthase F1 subunit delta [Dehalococcoidia bacterium]|jgi:F-type H+-transporting ATPase subunit delta|nr:ATP synthase F1 subunit delta [Dehalococcoidia bacterium]MDP6273265.1 ATP synthase F1 subunit delta [Dehalococcoidia bacterium]MDP7214016.1 ATP synthase F1 subunit delta [Dehalococcoidia bacterium]MDP7514484.1 ATP synthase F1 subunit delta [Dehalococcoidia bacterium]HCV27519.1 ATP synthase F1 subunit delta [Dehalococcoidia bacterium]|tara:strand:+ start:164 stop:715 length:552 start_codon:yes stop_codon:yes gene_type:complete